MVRQLAICSLAAIWLSGCDTWFGETEAPPLPGERISVLAHQNVLNPDPEANPNTIRLPRPMTNKDWPQSGGYANHAMHHLEVEAVPERAWRVDVGSGTSDQQPRLASPIVADGRVYTMDSDHLVTAFDAQSGEEIWEVDLADDEEDDDVISGGLAYENGRVFATTGFAKIIALNASTGEELWRQKVGAPVHSAPTVRGNRVFAISIDNTLHALSAYDGSTLWTYKAIVEIANLLGGASPAVDAGVVVAPFSSGELVALKVETGRVLWSDSLASTRKTDELGAISQIRAPPVIDRGRVYAISHSGVMAAIDLRTGRRVWDKDIGGLQAPWVAGDYVFQLTNESDLVCLSREDGRVYWVTQLPAFEDEEQLEDPILWTGPVLVSNRLIVAGSNEQAIAVSPYDGRMIGILETSDSVSAPIVIANRAIYILSDDADLVALK
jgi:outer membrane protein assembly factor BamB